MILLLGKPRSAMATPRRLGEGRQRAVLICCCCIARAVVERSADRRALGRSAAADGREGAQNHVGRLRRALDDREGPRLQTHGHGTQSNPGRRDRPRPIRNGSCARAARRSREGYRRRGDLSEALARVRRATVDEVRRAVRRARSRGSKSGTPRRRAAHPSRPGARPPRDLVGELEALGPSTASRGPAGQHSWSRCIAVAGKRMRSRPTGCAARAPHSGRRAGPALRECRRRSCAGSELRRTPRVGARAKPSTAPDRLLARRRSAGWCGGRPS